MTMVKPYTTLAKNNEARLVEHGDSHLGVGWPNAMDAIARYDVMLEVMARRSPAERVRLLDFGCGASHLYERILERGLTGISYAGLDVARPFIDLSTEKFPANPYYCVDILKETIELPAFDYVIINGLFTEKFDLSFDEMLNFLKEVIPKVFALGKRAIAFNVMSKHVDWERPDLFHVPFDLLAGFLTAGVTRKFQFRQDYGLYEYTVYAYR